MMIRLHQIFGAHAGRVVTFDGVVIKIGRHPTSDFAFDAFADIDASARHAEIRLEQNGYVVVDVGSRNGTWVNGQRVSRQVLATGDDIEFARGGPRVRVEVIEDASQLAATPQPRRPDGEEDSQVVATVPPREKSGQNGAPSGRLFDDPRVVRLVATICIGFAVLITVAAAAVWFALRK